MSYGFPCIRYLTAALKSQESRASLRAPAGQAPMATAVLTLRETTRHPRGGSGSCPERSRRNCKGRRRGAASSALSSPAPTARAAFMLLHTTHWYGSDTCTTRVPCRVPEPEQGPQGADVRVAAHGQDERDPCAGHGDRRTIAKPAIGQ